jgi:hypothetical protein
MQRFICLFFFITTISGCASTDNKQISHENKYDKHSIEKRLSILVKHTDQVEKSSNLIVSEITNDPKFDLRTKNKLCKATGSLISKNIIENLQAIVASLGKDQQLMIEEQKSKYLIYKSKVDEMQFGKPLCHLKA